MQLKLYYKKNYVREIPSKRLNVFRRILRKDNELAHLLHQVTYVTASDIKKIAINLHIFESFYISIQIPDNEIDSSTANIFLTIFL